MDDEQLRSAFAVWGTDWDALDPETKEKWRAEIDVEIGTESVAYGLDMLNRAEDLTNDPVFSRAIKIPGAIIALSQMQTVLDGLLTEHYGTSPIDHAEAESRDLVIGINRTVTVAVAIGFLLRNAMDATDSIEKMFNDEQEPEQ